MNQEIQGKQRLRMLISDLESTFLGNNIVEII